MRQASLITWVSILALLVGGCQIGEEETTLITPTPTSAASPPTAKPSPAATPFTNQPLVAQKPGNSPPVAGLIPPVPADDVLKRIPKGRSDPFAAVPVQPDVTVSPNPSAPGTPNNRPVPPLPQFPPQRLTRPNGGGTAGTRPPTPTSRVPRPAPRTNVSPQRRSQPTTTARRTQPGRFPAAAGTRSPRPGAAGSPTSSPANGSIAAAPPRLIPDLPKLPEPTQARGVAVTGVVEVGGVPVAIVQVPNEPARYVREGQRIANGQVLVKRIETNRGPTPVVILEQYGVEVARGVGEAPATGIPGQPPPPPTAFLPSQPQLNTVSPQA